MSGMWKILCIAVAASVLISPAVIAQEQEEDPYEGLPPFVDDSRRIEAAFSWVLQGTSMNFMHIEGGDESVNTSDISRGTVEMNLAYYFDRYKTFGIELMFGYTWGLGETQIPTIFRDPDNPIIFPIEMLDQEMLSYGVGLVYNFGYLDIVPFFHLGAGIDQVSPRGEESTFPVDDTFWHIQAGVGFKYYFKEWIAARLSLDDYFYFIPDDGVTTGNQNQFRLKIGAVLTF